MKGTSHTTRDPTESHRLGYMHARPGREPTVSSQIARRLGGAPATTFRRTSSRSMIGKDPATLISSNQGQRVTVRARISRHRAATAKAGLQRYTSYLGRDSASRDGQPGMFFDDKQNNLPASQTVGEWAADRHHFRLMLSPEQASDLQDLTSYTRRVMQRVGRDMSTPLTYLAISHHNTDNPHIHVLVRGRKVGGADLVIPWEYLSQRLPQRARDVATDLLGPRDPDMARRAQDRALQAQACTGLDRLIRQRMTMTDGRGQVDVGPASMTGTTLESRTRLIARLQFLSRLGLAENGRATKWFLDPQFDDKLATLARHRLLMARLMPALGSRAGQVQRLRPDTTVNGKVVAKGAVDEVSAKRFVVVEDRQGGLHYVPLRDGSAYRQVRVDTVLEVTRKCAGTRTPDGRERFQTRINGLNVQQRTRALRDYGLER